MSIAKETDWKKRLDAELEEKRRKEQEEKHPLASLKQDSSPENALSTEARGENPILISDIGTGGGQKEEGYTIPSDTREEAKKTREEMSAQANERLDMGQAEREAANAAGEALYQAILAFSEKQDGRYDELYSLVREDDYRKNSAAKEILYEYLKNGESAASDTAGKLSAENGGQTDSYSLAMAGKTKKQYAESGVEAARSYYTEYLDRLLEVLEASGKDMNALYANMQDNVDTAQKSANTDLTIGADLLEAIADAQTAERRVETTGFSEMLDAGNESQTLDVSPMRIDEEYKALTAKGTKDGNHTETEALMLLWDKYPSMRTYIMEKYVKEVKNPYIFQ